MSKELNKILKRILQNDKIAFKELFDKYKAEIFKYALFYLNTDNSESVAEDITQTVFIKIWQNLNRLSDFSKFDSWVRTIAKNSVFEYLKKKKIEKIKSINLKKFRGLFNDKTEGPEVDYQKNIEASYILEKIKLLPENQQTVILLYYYLDFSEKRISKIELCPIGTVKSRLHKARLNLLRLLNENK